MARTIEPTCIMADSILVDSFALFTPPSRHISDAYLSQLPGIHLHHKLDYHTYLWSPVAAAWDMIMRIIWRNVYKSTTIGEDLVCNILIDLLISVQLPGG